jgi:hypothetical protein
MATSPFPGTASVSFAARLPAACFKLASFTAIIGVTMGVYMGVAGDHSLAPVHVHLNLIGWVSLFLFGLYYRSHPDTRGRMAVAQVSLTGVGYVTMLGGLAGLLLTGNQTFLPLAIVGSLLVWAGFALFFIIVARTA